MDIKIDSDISFISQTIFDLLITPMDTENKANGIAKLFSNIYHMRELSGECVKRDYTNAGEIKKQYRISE